MIRILFILFSLPSVVVAQKTIQDTSYTVHSTYKKLLKSYPDIKIVQKEQPNGILSQEEIIYSSNGLLMNVYYPSQKAKYPGVLLIHGGGWRSGDKSMQVPMAQGLAAEGFVTAVVEYRLSLEAPYPAAVQDIKRAIRWLRANANEFHLDTSKIAVYGASAGGQLAALVGTTNDLTCINEDDENCNFSSSVQAIIDVDGILAFKHPESQENEMAAEWLGATYEENPKVWHDASALTHTDENTPPVLFIGSSKPRFHAGKADMIEILIENDIYYESYVFNDAPHGFWIFDPWFNPTLKYSAAFLNEVFKKN